VKPWRGRQEHVVYRMYDEDGRLLYIGVTCSMKRRLYAHRKATPWFHEIACLTSVPFEHRRAAFEAEAAAIRAEQPLYNVLCNERALATS
jgi:excinuclease UvrABC nuclease subunit